MKIIPILILSIFLTGCGFLENFKKKEEPPAITTNKVHIDKESLDLCVSLDETLVVRNFQDAVVAYSDLAVKYGNCANKQYNSVKLLKQFGNIK